MLDPIRGVADLASGDWDHFRAGLVAVLLDQNDGGMFNVQLKAEVVPPVRAPARSLLGRLLGRHRHSIPPALQFFRIEECLFCACVGPLEDGGGAALSAAQQSAIRRLGWRQATGDQRERFGWPAFRAYFPHEGEDIAVPPSLPPPGPYPKNVDAERAARLAIDTLRGPLGARTPQDLTVSRSG